MFLCVFYGNISQTLGTFFLPFHQLKIGVLYDPFNSNEWRETKVMYVGISDKIAHFLDSQIATNNSPGIKNIIFGQTQTLG